MENRTNLIDCQDHLLDIQQDFKIVSLKISKMQQDIKNHQAFKDKSSFKIFETDTLQELDLIYSKLQSVQYLTDSNTKKQIRKFTQHYQSQRKYLNKMNQDYLKQEYQYNQDQQHQEQQQQIQIEKQSNQQLKIIEQKCINSEQFLQNRQNELNDINGLVLKINDFMKETVDVAQNQQQMINVVQDQIVDTYDNTYKALQEMKQTDKMVQKKRQRYVNFFSIIFIIILIVSAISYFRLMN